MTSTPTTALAVRTPLREQVAMTIVNAMKPIYFLLRRNRRAWDVTEESLAQMPEGTLGNDLARFLVANNIRLMPKAEFHDVYHVLFGFGTTMKEETCIQFIPLGNGRYTVPHIITNMVSVVFYPENWEYYYAAFQRGRRANRFHNWNFEPMLDMKTTEVRRLIFDK